jgi:hypothetical protein
LDDALRGLWLSQIHRERRNPRARVLDARPGPLWEIAIAIAPDGAAFPGGISALVVSDVLSVGEPDNWPKTSRDSWKSAELFTRHVQMTRHARGQPIVSPRGFVAGR